VIPWRASVGWALLTLPLWGTLGVWAMWGPAYAAYMILAIFGVSAMFVIMALGLLLTQWGQVYEGDTYPYHH
jgi:hypothetical protein